VVVRLGISALVLIAASAALRLRVPRGVPLWASLGAGALIFGLNFSLLYIGELTVPSGTAAVLWGVFPILTAFGAAALLQGAEPLTVRGLGGAALAATGLVVVFWAQLGTASLTGLLAILGGIVCAAAGALVVKRFAHDVHPVLFNALGNATGAAGIGLVLVLSGRRAVLPPTPEAWGALLYLVVVGSLLAFTAWAWLLKRWPATRLSFQTVLSPLIAVVLGALVLEEDVGLAFLAGTALVLAGTWVAARPRAAA